MDASSVFNLFALILAIVTPEEFIYVAFTTVTWRRESSLVVPAVIRRSSFAFGSVRELSPERVRPRRSCWGAPVIDEVCCRLNARQIKLAGMEIFVDGSEARPVVLANTRLEAAKEIWNVPKVSQRSPGTWETGVSLMR